MSVRKEGIEQHVIKHCQMGRPGKAYDIVSQETSVFSELWDCSLFYKWDQRGIKVWFAFSQSLSAFMSVWLWAAGNNCRRSMAVQELCFREGRVGGQSHEGPAQQEIGPCLPVAPGPCAAHTSWPHTQGCRAQLA